MRLALLFSAAIGLLATTAASARVLSADDWQALRNVTVPATAADAVRAARQVLDTPSIDPVQREYRLEALARQIGQGPASAEARDVLTALLQEPVVAYAALEESGRTVPVPAFPVAAAARAVLRDWDQQAVENGVTRALVAGDLAALQAWLDGDSATASRTIAASLTSAMPVGVEMATLQGLRHDARLAVALRTQDFDPWLQALALPGITHSAALTDFERLIANTPAPQARALLQQAIQAGAAPSAAIHSLGEIAMDDPVALQVLAERLSDPMLGADVALALARLGLPGVAPLRQALASEQPRAWVPALLGLRAANDQASLQAFVRDTTRPLAMREQVRTWLR